MNALTKKIEFAPAFNKGEKYGIHCMEIRFLLSGESGVVQFLLFTGWYLPDDAKRLRDSCRGGGYCPSAPIPADIGYHALAPVYEGQEIMQKECRYLGGNPCYYDGSGLEAERYFNTLIRDGEDALWKEMEAYYNYIFVEKKP